MKSSSCPGYDYAGIEAKAEWHLHVGLETEAFVSEFHLILTSRDFGRAHASHSSSKRGFPSIEWSLFLFNEIEYVIQKKDRSKQVPIQKACQKAHKISRGYYFQAGASERSDMKLEGQAKTAFVHVIIAVRCYSMWCDEPECTYFILTFLGNSDFFTSFPVLCHDHFRFIFKYSHRQWLCVIALS